MLLEIILLLAGLGLIIKGGDLFVAASVRIAEFLHMPRVVIGSTLVSLATTTPELVVSIMAGAKGESGLAVGNAVGSCICNLGLILGVTAALKQIDVHPRVLRTPLIAMFGFGVLLFILTFNLTLSRGNGLMLLLLGLGYFIYDFQHHLRAAKPREVKEAEIVHEEVVERFRWLKTRTGTAAQFFGAAGIVVLGSKLLVDAAVNIAGALGIPSIVIGLTVVAVGTSLPELITAITSSRQNVSDLAVGNVLGANIANLSLIVGTAAVIHEVTMSRATQVFNFPALLITMGLALFMILSGKRVTRREGATLLVFYSLYIVALIGMTLATRN
ncbi:MAG: calcium/sodium antiporter [Verrucomicrobiota bacterium]